MDSYISKLGDGRDGDNILNITIGNKLPQDALNPTHASLFMVNTQSKRRYYRPILLHFY